MLGEAGVEERFEGKVLMAVDFSGFDFPAESTGQVWTEVWYFKSATSTNAQFGGRMASMLLLVFLVCCCHWK